MTDDQLNQLIEAMKTLQVNKEGIGAIYEKYETTVFAGFITIGTFIFTAKTFIIQTMKANVYDHPDYIEMVENYNAIKGKNKKDRLTELNNMRLFLTATIWLSFLAATLTFLVSFLGVNVAEPYVMIFWGITWIVTLISIHLVMKNIKYLVNGKQLKH